MFASLYKENSCLCSYSITIPVFLPFEKKKHLFSGAYFTLISVPAEAGKS